MSNLEEHDVTTFELPSKRVRKTIAYKCHMIARGGLPIIGDAIVEHDAKGHRGPAHDHPGARQTSTAAAIRWRLPRGSW